MDQATKQKVLDVLGYWELLEFLEQKNIERQEKSTKEEISDLILKGIPLSDKLKSIEIYHDIDNKITDEISIDDFFDKGEKSTDELLNEDVEKIKQLNIKELLSDDNNYFKEFSDKDDEYTFYIGNIPRNNIVEYLIKYLPDEDRIEAEESPELPYQQDEAIAWFTFKTDAEGRYIEKSFGLSPILWTLGEWKKSGDDLKSYSIDTVQYKAVCEQFEMFLDKIIKKYGSARIEIFLPEIYKRIFKTYVQILFPNLLHSSDHAIGFFKYERQKPSNKNKRSSFFSKMGSGSFYLDEISHLKKQIADDQFGSRSDYERSVINFILSADHKRTGNEIVERISISPKNNIKDSFRFFSDILNIKNAPNAKWPSAFMPALMQQTAVNIVIRNDDKNIPIFSVNGPPGTGKTTMLKEILANNIVERAKAIADHAGDDPDSIFEECQFKSGKIQEGQKTFYTKNAPNYYKIAHEFDEINNYGMLVASCNNAAVENITIDLPQLDELLGNLVRKDDNNNEIEDPALKEIHDLFDPELGDKETILVYDKTLKKEVETEVRDILFTRYSDALVNSEDDKDEDKGSARIKTWGLISAPLGKNANVKKYCNAVLIPFLKDYGSPAVRAEHLKKYREIRRRFLDQYEYVEALKSELEKLCHDCAADPNSFKLPEKFGNNDKPSVIDREFMLKYISEDEDVPAAEDNDTSKEPVSDSTLAQLSNPWATEKFNREREKLFFYACKLHKEFVTSSDCMRQNIENALVAWGINGFMGWGDKCRAFPILLQSLFLLTPVFSTTFASVKTFLSSAKRAGFIGMLIVDEAGQASPHVAVGALYRCRKAVIVGDPKQIEPVVTAETDMFKKIMTSDMLSGYKDKKISVQGFADYINPYGTFLGEGTEREWVGCPLVVHRRCTDPMYTIANKLSYDGTMKNRKKRPSKEDIYILPGSCWIDVQGKETGNKIHYVDKQGDVVLKLLAAAFKKINNPNDLPKLYIISPFTSIKHGIEAKIRKSELYKSEPRVKEWLKGENIGTVHTFQGKGTDEVIFLLGCDKTSIPAANWVNKNIVSVAATRAKKRFYMIGDKNVWSECQPVKTAREIINNEITETDVDTLLAKYLTPDQHTVMTYIPTAAALQPQEPKPTPLSVVPQPQKARTAPQTNAPARICPKCGSVMIKKTGPYGDYWSCTKDTDPDCTYTVKALFMCPECGKKITEKSGPYGKFWSCVDFKNCTYKPKCPKCGSTLNLITKEDGAKVWSCNKDDYTANEPPPRK